MPTLQELIAFDVEQGKAKLRTLQLVFSATLARLPTLQREIQGWLNQDTQGVDFIGLAEWAEPALLAATDWLQAYDRLPAEVQQVDGMQDFMRTACEDMGIATAVSMIREFERVQMEAQEYAERKRLEAEEAQRRADEERREAQARQEAQRRADEERREAQARQEAQERAERERLEAEKAQRQADKARREAQARVDAKELAKRERLEAEKAQRQADKERLEAQERWKSHQDKLKVATPEMVATPAGEREFSMGSGFFALLFFRPSYAAVEAPSHTVRIKQFEIGKYPVTRKQWKAVMGSFPDSGSDELWPVSNVSWDDVQGYLRELNRLTAKNYRLPSEAEWEYAARAGKKFVQSGSNLPDKVAWYKENSGGQKHPVGMKLPNSFGLHDMSGNVWEWVQDRWHEDYRGAPRDGTAWVHGESDKHVIRGGCWNSEYDDLCVTRRSYLKEDRGTIVGFRLARTID